MGKNIVQFGISEVAFAVFNDEDCTYGSWVDLPDAKTLSLSAEGSSDKTYADNVPRYTANKNAGYSGAMTFLTIPDEFRTQILGEAKDTVSGGLYEDANAVPKTCAVKFKVDGNDHDETTVFYNVSFSRPAGDHSTNEDSLSIHEVSLDYTAIGRDFVIGGKTVNVIRETCENTTENAEKYKTFVSSVVVPSGGTVKGATASA